MNDDGLLNAKHRSSSTLISKFSHKIYVFLSQVIFFTQSAHLGSKLHSLPSTGAVPGLAERRQSCASQVELFVAAKLCLCSKIRALEVSPSCLFVMDNGRLAPELARCSRCRVVAARWYRLVKLCCRQSAPGLGCSTRYDSSLAELVPLAAELRSRTVIAEVAANLLSLSAVRRVFLLVSLLSTVMIF